MATADRLKSRRVHVVGALAVVLLAGVVFAVGRDDGTSSESRRERDTVAVTSSTRHQFTDLEGLLAASDLVVMGRAIAAEPGRTFGGVDDEGDASADAIRSRVLTVEVRTVLLSRDPGTDPPPGAVVLVEEEASTARRHADRGGRRTPDKGRRCGHLVPCRVARPGVPGLHRGELPGPLPAEPPRERGRRKSARRRPIGRVRPPARGPRPRRPRRGSRRPRPCLTRQTPTCVSRGGYTPFVDAGSFVWPSAEQCLPDEAAALHAGRTPRTARCRCGGCTR